jgi:hypothetical protein
MKILEMGNDAVSIIHGKNKNFKLIKEFLFEWNYGLFLRSENR